MGPDGRLSIGGPSSVKKLPADLAAVLLIVLLTLIAVFVPDIRETPLRVLIGLPFLLFVPGYVLLAALFPEAHPESRGEDPIPPTVLYPDEIRPSGPDEPANLGGITTVERIGLSFAGSIIVVVVIGIVLNNTPFGIQLVPVVGATSAAVVGLLVVAVRRRFAIPPQARFRVPWRARLAGLYTELFSPENRTDALLNATLVLALLIAASSVGYAIVVPTEGQSYTELYLLTETDGELTAENYPTELTAGESQSLVVGVGNREHETVTYTVFVELQHVRLGNNSTQVLETERLDRFQQRLSSNETWHHRHSVAPTMTGEPLRLTYLLYRGSPPRDPTVDNAYRDLHLWVNVTTR